MTWARWTLTVIGVLGGGVAFLLFFSGLAMASAPSAAFIHKTMVIWVALMAGPFLGERLGLAPILALGVLIAGQALILPPLGISWGVGETLIAAATLIWALEVVLAKRVLGRVRSPIVGVARLGIGLVVLFGYLAVTGQWSDPWWVLAAITVAVATWVAGFDVFYALPDEQFDRSVGLRSAVVRLGVPRAILLAKLLHGLTIPALVLFGYGVGFGPWYYAGVAVAAGILVHEHQLVRADDLSRLDAAFFTMNAVMSVVVFAFALLDRLT